MNQKLPPTKPHNWWLKMLPYFVAVAWTISITILVVHNTAAVAKDASEKTKAVCLADVKLKAVVDQIITKQASDGATKEAIFWIQLDRQLNQDARYDVCAKS